VSGAPEGRRLTTIRSFLRPKAAMFENRSVWNLTDVLRTLHEDFVDEEVQSDTVLTAR